MGTAGLALQGVLVAAAGFLLGAVNPATLLARSRGRDLRAVGSGNPGATNAGRVLGRPWGVLVLVLDVAKAYLPTLLVLRSVGLLAALVVGLTVVLGHVYSPFLRGRGGKGVACAFGATLALEPLVALGAVVVFAMAIALVRVIGQASVLTALGLAAVGALAVAGVVPTVPRAVGVWLVVVSLVVVSRHRRNVRDWWGRVRG